MFWNTLKPQLKPGIRRKSRAYQAQASRQLRVESLESRRLLSATDPYSSSADFNYDGKIDGFDFLSWQRNFGATDATAQQGDADSNQTVNLNDFGEWESNFGSGVTSSSRVIFSSISDGEQISEGTIIYTAQFDSTFDTNSLDADDVLLTGQSTGTISPSIFSYDVATSTLTLEFENLTDDQYSLTLLSNANAFNGLDGETTPGSVIPSGDGSFGGDFSVNFSVDSVTQAFPTPTTPKSPLGSLIYDANTTGIIDSSIDTDSFTLDIDDGQTISLVVETDGSLQGSVELRDPSNAVIGTATASAAGETVLLQVVPTTGPGTYTITVSGAAASTGSYTVQLVLNAAIETETHGGATNNSLATAQDLDPSFISLGGSSATRGAVLGTTDGTGAGAGVSLTKDNTIYYPNVLNYAFSGLTAPHGAGTLTLSGVMDLDATSEYLTLNAEGHFSQRIFEFDGAQQSFVTTTINISQVDLAAMLADDGVITFTVTPSSSVHNLGPNYLTLDLTYPSAPPTTDYYSFSLLAGQSSTIALTGQNGGDIELELLDAAGTLITTGTAAGNVDQVINNYVSSSGGTYYVNVIGETQDEYSLIITQDADFDTEDNSSLAEAQHIGTSQTIVGSLNGEAPAGALGDVVEEDTTPGEAIGGVVEPAASSGRLIISFEELGDLDIPTKVAELGATLIREMPIINGALIELTAGMVGAAGLFAHDTDPVLSTNQLLDVASSLQVDSSIAYVEPDYDLQLLETIPNDPDFSRLYGLHNTGQTGGTFDADIDAPEAWDQFTGSTSVVIASIDTGVDYDHVDLAANMWRNPGEFGGIPGVDDDGNGYIDDIYGIDAINDDSDPMDDNSHGTHTAGTFGGVGNNGIGVAGVNWDVQIMALKFLGGGGSGSTADAIETIEYMTMMKTVYGVNVVASNNSWGGGAFSTALRDAIQASNDAGIMFVAAAGNNNSNNDFSPAYPASYDLPGIISVAATDHNDQRASFSNYGATTVDLGAPGVNTWSTSPGNSYSFKSGTSMASPHVAGAVGMLMANSPGSSLAEIKAAILNGTNQVASMNGITVSGGRLNLANSLALLGDPGDYYQFEVQALDNLTLTTSTPSDGAGEFINLLDPFIELYDPTGLLVGTDNNGAVDGRNALLTHTATTTGTYTVRVASSAEAGEYVLEILGATGSLPSYVVTSTDPVDGTTFATAPTEITVNLSSAALLPSVDASDLSVNGIAATAVSIIDNNTLRFTLPSLIEGLNNYAIAAGAITSIQNQPIEAYAGQFELDTTAPRVISTSIQEGDTANAGNLTYTVRFDEEINAANLDSSDIQLFGVNTGSQSPASLNYDTNTSILTIEYEALAEDLYTLTLISGDGAFEDLIGHDLDGEPLLFPIPGNVSGNGAPGGNFFVNFDTDFGIAPYPVPLTAKSPLGSLIYDPSIGGLIGSAGDTDSFTLDIDDGQTISLVVETDGSLQGSVELRDPSNAVIGTATASAAGETVLLQVVPTTGPGTYTITVSGAAASTGSYTVQLVLNSAIETETHGGATNNSLATAQDLDPSFISLGGSSATRGAVLGTTDGTGAGAGVSLTKDNTIYYPNVLNYAFSGLTAPHGAGTLTLSGVMDLDATSEYLTLNAEGHFSQRIFEFDGAQQSFVTTTINISQADLAAMLADDGVITFTVTPSSSVHNLGPNYLTLDLTYPSAPPTTDYYSFSLLAGQSSTIALTGQNGGDFELELLDAAGTLITTGTAAGNVDQVINNYVSSSGGTYYVNVIGETQDEYSLIITQDADFDTELNNDLGTAQLLSPRQVVLGSITEGSTPGNIHIGLIQDSLPWGRSSNNAIATELGYAITTIDSSQLGHTDLSNFDFIVLAGAQSSSTYGNVVQNMPSIENYVNSGGVWLVNYAAPDAQLPYSYDVLPGANSLTFTGQYGSEINIVTANSDLITGPGGTITNTNLDGGNYSTHGYTASLMPANATSILSTNNASQIVAFDYAYGSGNVVVHTLPVEFYNGIGHGIGQIFHRNLFNFAAGLNVEDSDYFNIQGQAGAILSFQTRIPASGPGEFVNNLDVALELYDPAGNLVASDTSGALTHMATSTGLYTIHILAENDTSGEYVLFVNSPPVIEDTDLVLSDTTIVENQSVTLTGSYTDSDLGDTHTVVVDWGDGTTSLAIVDQGNDTFMASHLYADDGLTPGGSPTFDYSIVVTVTDDSPLADSDTAMTLITVNNVDPSITSFISSAPFSNPAATFQSILFTGAFTDTGSLDTHSATIDWGDGSPAQAVAITPTAGGGTISKSHTFAGGGVFTVTLTITDDDTGIGTLTTQAVVIGVGVNNGVLQIVGTNGDDAAYVRDWYGGKYRIAADFLPSPGYVDLDKGPIQAIEAYMLGGNDHITIFDNVYIPAYLDTADGNDYLYAGSGDTHLVGGPGADWLVGDIGNDILEGGEGNDNIQGGDGNDLLLGEDGNDLLSGGQGDDRLFGGEDDDSLYGNAGNDILRGGNGNDNLYDYDGNNILLGDDGNDLLVGGSGRSILIGGLGLDHLISGGASDILIGNATTYDDHDAALLALLDEWTSVSTRSERITNIANGAGPILSGPGYSLENGTTVIDDGEEDLVDGFFSEDWLFI